MYLNKTKFICARSLPNAFDNFKYWDVRALPLLPTSYDHTTKARNFLIFHSALWNSFVRNIYVTKINCSKLLKTTLWTFANCRLNLFHLFWYFDFSSFSSSLKKSQSSNLYRSTLTASSIKISAHIIKFLHLSKKPSFIKKIWREKNLRQFQNSFLKLYD
jgi:hypothetical protein